MCVYLSYSVLFVNYLVPLKSTMYTFYRDSASAGVALSAFLLFISCLLILVPSNIQVFEKNNKLFTVSSSNPLIVSIIIGILGLILVYGFGRPEAIGSDRGTPSPIYEYAVIFFIIGFYFAGNRKGLKTALSIFAALFALQNIIYGGRIMALQIILAVFFCLFSQKTTSRTFSILIIAGLLLFTFFGSVRTGLAEAGFNEIAEAWCDSISRGFAWDTAYSAWHTSVTFILYGGMISPEGHLNLFLQWAKSVFMGGSVELSQLPTVTYSYFPHSGGGVLPIFFQFYLGPLGVVLASAYVAFALNLVNSACDSSGTRKGRTGSGTLKICALYIAVSSFRWILYSPSSITRGLLLCALCSVAAIWIDKQMRGEKQ